MSELGFNPEFTHLLTYLNQQRGQTETGPRFKVSSKRPEKRGIDLAIPGLVVNCVIHYTTGAPKVQTSLFHLKPQNSFLIVLKLDLRWLDVQNSLLFSGFLRLF